MPQRKPALALSVGLQTVAQVLELQLSVHTRASVDPSEAVPGCGMQVPAGLPQDSPALAPLQTDNMQTLPGVAVPCSAVHFPVPTEVAMQSASEEHGISHTGLP